MVYDVKYKIKQNDGKKYISGENYLKFVLKGKEYVSLESKIRTKNGHILWPKVF